MDLSTKYPYLFDHFEKYIDKIELSILFNKGLKTNLKFGIFEFQHIIPKKRNEEPPHIQPLGLSHQGVLEFLEYIGVKRVVSNSRSIIVFENNNVIEIIESDFIKHLIRSLIDNWDNISFSYDETPFEIAKEGMLELYLSNMHKQINDKWLESVNVLTVPFLKDNRESSFFPFTNQIVKVTKEAITLLEYVDFSEYVIWKDSIIKHSLTPIKDSDVFNSQFARFLQNVSNNDEERFLALMSAIGYLLHNYQIPSVSKVVIFYDESITDNKIPMGGTGKSLLVKGVGKTRNLAKMDGKAFDSHDRFLFQNVELDTQVLFIDETSKRFDFDTLNSVVTDGMNVEKKNQKRFHIPAHASPKIVITTNTTIATEGTTRMRRQYIVELSNFYSKLLEQGIQEPIVHVHGHLFFDEWDRDEWNLFYSFMLRCSHLFLAHGLVPYQHINVKENRLIQSTSADFYEWIKQKNLTLDTRYDTKELFDEFQSIYLGNDPKFLQKHFTTYIKEYAKSIDAVYIRKPSNGLSYFLLQSASNPK